MRSVMFQSGVYPVSGHYHLSYDNDSIMHKFKTYQKIKALCGHSLVVDMREGIRKISHKKINDILQLPREDKLRCKYCTTCLKNA